MENEKNIKKEEKTTSIDQTEKNTIESEEPKYYTDQRIFFNEEWEPILLSELLNDIKSSVSKDNFELVLDNYLNKIQVKLYMMMVDKVSKVVKIINSYKYLPLDTIEYQTAAIYVNEFFYGMIEGYTNLILDDAELVTYENYDILYGIFSNAFKTICGEDYKLLCDMVRDSLNLGGIADFIESFEMMDFLHMGEASEASREMVHYLINNSENLNAMRDLMAFNDPLNKQVTDMIKQSALALTQEEEK